ncbi:hypothetical protein XI09_09480 [Bradyrhizobium sp. CCBAU 11386]|nr:hypothetical protein [Bradyrhizobium sp. CCBAU 11386]
MKRLTLEARRELADGFDVRFTATFVKMTALNHHKGTKALPLQNCWLYVIGVCFLLKYSRGHDGS